MSLVYMTVFSYALDMLVRFARRPEDPESEFPAANTLSIALALAHFAVLPMVIYALSHDTLTGWQKIWLFLAAGQFCGQVSNSNAHELIHRTDTTLRRLGTWVYISVLFGHHASAHPKVHHKYVATDLDPNSAPKGMSFYQFFPRAWIGSLKAGFLAENTQRARGKARGAHPYVSYVLGAVLCLCIAALIGGFGGVFAYVLICLYTSAQLMLSDYVQHYGLRRHPRADGKFDPVGPKHAWNSPHWFSSYLLLNAPRHSDHHAHPMTPYVGLELADDDPLLPRPLPTMATLALCPPLWRRVMDKRVDRITVMTAPEVH